MHITTARIENLCQKRYFMNDSGKQSRIRIKRVYDPPDKEDGFRVLVDRLWPRGLAKKKAAVDLWLKDVAPSSKLRTWFNHDGKKWQDFRRKYSKELEKSSAFLELQKIVKKQRTVTLLFAAKDE